MGVESANSPATSASFSPREMKSQVTKSGKTAVETRCIDSFRHLLWEAPNATANDEAIFLVKLEDGTVPTRTVHEVHQSAGSTLRE